MANFSNFFDNPVFQYIISPTIVVTFTIFLMKKIFHFGELIEKLNKSFIDIDELKKDMKRILHDMGVIKMHLVSKTGLDSRLFKSQ